MNMKKLTLLIALSIFLVVVLLMFSVGASNPTNEQNNITTTTITTTEHEKEPEEIIKVEPKTIAEQIWEGMKAKGWSDEVCAGILGNIMAECGGGTLSIQPYAHGDGRTSYGICQWHNERKQNMLKFNNQNYNTTTNLPTIEHQIDFIEYELELYNINIIDSKKSYQDIAYIFCVQFEIPHNKYKKAEQRKQYAKIAYQEFAI